MLAEVLLRLPYARRKVIKLRWCDVDLVFVLNLEHALLLHRAVTAACQALIASYQELNRLDSACGDGDCGSTLKSGAEGNYNFFLKDDRTDVHVFQCVIVYVIILLLLFAKCMCI